MQSWCRVPKAPQHGHLRSIRNRGLSSVGSLRMAASPCVVHPTTEARAGPGVLITLKHGRQGLMRAS